MELELVVLLRDDGPGRRLLLEEKKNLRELRVKYILDDH